MIQVEVGIWGYPWSDPLDTLGYQIVKVTGLNPVKVNINTGSISGADGGYFISEQLTARNIVLTLQPIDASKTIEEMRLELYDLFMIKAKNGIQLRLKTENRYVGIDGRVETIEVDPFSNPQLVQISVLCPDPYFYPFGSGVRKTFEDDTYGNPVAEFSFTDIYSCPDGDLAFVMNITANVDIKKMVISAGYSIAEIVDISAGDVIVYNTITGQKTITKNGIVYFSGYSGDFEQMRRIYTTYNYKLNLQLYDANDDSLSSSAISGDVVARPRFWGL